MVAGLRCKALELKVFITKASLKYFDWTIEMMLTVLLQDTFNSCTITTI